MTERHEMRGVCVLGGWGADGSGEGSGGVVGYLGSNGGRGDVGRAVLVMVVVVGVSTSPPVVVVVVIVRLLALGAALHGVHVGVRVGVGVGHGQLLQGGVCGLHADHGLAQQVDGMRQRWQDELETLLREATERLRVKSVKRILFGFFKKNKSDNLKISTRYNCNLMAFPMFGVKKV